MGLTTSDDHIAIRDNGLWITTLKVSKLRIICNDFSFKSTQVGAADADTSEYRPCK